MSYSNVDFLEYSRSTKRNEFNFRFLPSNNLLDSKYFEKIDKVRCIALNTSNKVCLVSYNGRYWMLPGGTIENSENPILALKRELREEGDIDIHNYKLVGFLEKAIFSKKYFRYSKHIEMIFIARISKEYQQTPDPAIGMTLKRAYFDYKLALPKYMKLSKITDYIIKYIDNYIKEN
ncbi:MAG: NUDIX hydrolase [Candidatus Dojkabacteria bacterium]|nr:NUDIX hydrolase [Candidatus Dojkabacteria bacterium]